MIFHGFSQLHVFREAECQIDCQNLVNNKRNSIEECISCRANTHQAMRLSLIFPENVFFCEKAEVDIKGLHHKWNAVIWPTNKKVIPTFQTILQNMLSVGSKHNCSNFWSTGTISFKGQPNFSVDISNKKSKTSLFKSFLRKERKWCTNFQV